MASKNAFRIPKTLAGCADALFTMRQDRLDLQKQVDAIKERENELRAHLIETIHKQGATGIAGNLARVTVVDKVRPVAEDWDKIREWIIKYDGWQVMNRALNAASIREVWDNGKTIPGIGAEEYQDLSINKV